MAFSRLPVDAVRRVRLLPAAALTAALATYALHHTPPLRGHGLGSGALAVLVAVAVSAVLAVPAPLVNRRLPVVVSLMRGEDVGVRALCAHELDFGAALQRETLGHAFFPQLGHRFLRAYLATFVGSPHAAAFVATRGDAPLGMVVGALDPRSHGRWVLRHRAAGLALRGAWALLIRPTLAARFVRTRLLPYGRALRRMRQPANPGGEGRVAVLTHLAVVPGAQGFGIGGRLVAAYLEAARAAGRQRVVLNTLTGPSGAGGFYRRHGWREDGERSTFDGRRSLLFSIDVDRPSR